jgi:hypothetical protein
MPATSKHLGRFGCFASAPAKTTKPKTTKPKTTKPNDPDPNTKQRACKNFLETRPKSTAENLNNNRSIVLTTSANRSAPFPHFRAALAARPPLRYHLWWALMWSLAERFQTVRKPPQIGGT